MGGSFNLEKTMVSVLHKKLEYKVDKLKDKKVGGAVGSISTVSRVRSLILPEELIRGMSVGSFSRTAAGNRA